MPVTQTPQRLVLKVGSSLVAGRKGVNHEFIHQLGKEMQLARKVCPQIVLVSSGAVAVGLPLLGWQSRPNDFTDLQVAAAVGQIHLYGDYVNILTSYGFKPAQYLLTSSDLADRSTFLNTRATMRRLLENDVLPIVNENDALPINSRRLGDNDHFAAEMANLLDADLLVLLTDVEGIYTDLATHEVLKEKLAADKSLDAYVATDAKSRVGSGGMAAKIAAARLAATGGIPTVIMSGHNTTALADLLRGKPIGTLLSAPVAWMSAKGRWLRNSANSQGSVTLDAGAAVKVCEQGKSLLPIGVIAVTGKFQRGDVIDLCDPTGKVIARGLCNYDAKDVAQLLRKHSSEIAHVLGYVVAEELIHRDNMALMS